MSIRVAHQGVFGESLASFSAGVCQVFLNQSGLL